MYRCAVARKRKLKALSSYAISLLFALFVISIFIGCTNKNNTTSATDATPWAQVIDAKSDDEGKKENISTETPAPTKEPLTTIEYIISVDINPETRSAMGTEKLIYRNKTGMELTKIYFNVYLNAFSYNTKNTPYFESFENNIFPDGEIDYGYMDIVDVKSGNESLEFILDETVLTVVLNEPLELDTETEITIYFDAYIPKINHRTGANDNIMWFGNFFPILSVYDKAGWNTHPYYPAGDPFYSRMANYTVTATTPEGYAVIGTGEESYNESDQKRITTVTAKMVRDFAFAVSNKLNLEITKTASNKYINIYYYSNLKNLEEIKDIAVRSFNYFTQTVGTYPYSTFDIIETGLFISSGMEYPGLAFLESSYMQKGQPYYSLAHEIGHQWFYNLVGNNQVTEAWLDEGITSFMQLPVFYSDVEIMEIMKNDYNVLSELIQTMPHNALTDDISSFTSWMDYTSVHHTRAKLMLFSLKLKLGDAVFNEIIRNYYSKFLYGIATTDDFIITAEETSGLDLTDFFDQWIIGKTLPPLE